jgi:hypothetical protein
MTIAATTLTSGSSSSNLSAFTTASVRPSPNRLLLLAVAQKQVGTTATSPATVTGNGLTWTAVATVDMWLSVKANLTLYRAMGTAPTTGTITITSTSGTYDACAWSLTEFIGPVASGSGGADAIVQYATASADDVDTLEIALAAFASTANATYAAFGAGSDLSVVRTNTPADGFTELHDTGAQNTSVGTAWRNNNSLTASTTLNDVASGLAGIAVEIAFMKALPLPSLAITGEEPVFMPVPLPVLSCGNLTVPEALPNQAFLALPAPSTDIIGWENTGAIAGDIALALPAPSTATGDIDGVALALTPSLAIEALAGIIDLYTEVPVAPAPQLAIEGSSGVVGDVAFDAPVFQLLAFDPDGTALAVPAPQLAIEADTGLIGTMALAPRAPALAATGRVQFVGTMALQLIRPSLAAAAAAGTRGAVVLRLRAPALAGAGVTGIKGAVAAALPAPALAIGGSGPLVGAVVFALPQMLPAILGRESAGATFATLAMHTGTLALSAYENYPFNAFARFNGVYLGASAQGVFALTGADDDGAAIDATVRLGKLDCSTSHMKRVERCYVGYRADGDLVLSVAADEGTVASYALASNASTTLHGARVVLAKGVSGRYWQFTLTNTDGADFQLDALEAVPAVLARRVKAA